MIDATKPYEEQPPRRWLVWYYPQFVTPPPGSAPRYLVAETDDLAEANRLRRRNCVVEENVRWRLSQR